MMTERKEKACQHNEKVAERVQNAQQQLQERQEGIKAKWEQKKGSKVKGELFSRVTPPPSRVGANTIDTTDVFLEEQKKKETEAATKIQINFRGHQASQQKKKETEAATKIQTNFRGHQASQQKKKETKKKTEAATKIQTHFRGHQDKKKADVDKMREVGDPRLDQQDEKK